MISKKSFSFVSGNFDRCQYILFHLICLHKLHLQLVVLCIPFKYISFHISVSSVMVENVRLVALFSAAMFSFATFITGRCVYVIVAASNFLPSSMFSDLHSAICLSFLSLQIFHIYGLSTVTVAKVLSYPS